MKSRRFSLYFSWDRSSETRLPPGSLDDRYPTLFEIRRQLWPRFGPDWLRDHPEQDVHGFLDLVVRRDFEPFAAAVSEATGQPVRVAERRGRAPTLTLLDAALLDQTDSLVLVSLDHLTNDTLPQPDEVEAVRAFLAREESCLIVAPHHDIGEDAQQRVVEQRHHGDALVPSRQRVGGFAAALLAALDLPIRSRYGLCPAVSAPGEPAPLLVDRERDRLGILDGVDTFNAHPHLPHLEVAAAARPSVLTLARQRIHPDAPPHPFVDAGNAVFDAFHWIPPAGARRGQLFVCDATLFSAAFGGQASLTRLWRNLARL